MTETALIRGAVPGLFAVVLTGGTRPTGIGTP
jgi:hypothetical protein